MHSSFDVRRPAKIQIQGPGAGFAIGLLPLRIVFLSGCDFFNVVMSVSPFAFQFNANASSITKHLAAVILSIAKDPVFAFGVARQQVASPADEERPDAGCS